MAVRKTVGYMKKKTKSIANPEELNKNLQYSSPISWIVLTSVVLLLAVFFVWASVYQIQIKVTGTASIQSGQASLVVEEASLKKLEVGQKVYIAGIEGEILSFNDDEPVVSDFSLADGDYAYYIVIKEVKPMDFLFSR